MRTITFQFFLILAIPFYAQTITVTQNNSPNTINQASIACMVNEADVNEDEGFFLGMYFDNYFARAFDLQNDHGIDGDFLVSSVGIGQGFSETTQIDINIYSANTDDLTDPDLELQLIENKQLPVLELNFGEIVFVSTEAIIPAGEILVIEVFAPNSGQATNQRFVMGMNDDGQTKPSYIKAPECDTDSYIDASTVSSTEQNYIMQAIGEETLSINQSILDKIEVYPNPVFNDINLNLPPGLIIEKASITDMFGKRREVQFVDGKMDASSLTTGQYILTLQTDSGSYSHKVIKK